MKKALSIFTIIALIGAYFSLSHAQDKGKDDDMNYNPTHAIGASLPNFKMKTTGGKEMTNKDYASYDNLVLFLFNPTCGHCMDMAHRMDSATHSWPKVKVVFLAAPELKPYIPEFYRMAPIKENTLVTVAFDQSKLIDTLFEYNSVPQINIYNKERKLVKKFYSTTPVDSIEAYLK